MARTGRVYVLRDLQGTMVYTGSTEGPVPDACTVTAASADPIRSRARCIATRLSGTVACQTTVKRP